MEISTKIYELSSDNVPGIRSFIDTEYAKIASYDSHIDSLAIYDFIDDINIYTQKTIASEVTDDYVATNFKALSGDNHHLLLKDVISIIGEQRQYAHLHGNVRRYFIMATLNDIPYGGIYAFYNPATPQILFIQAITKFATPSIINIYFPEIDQRYPRLNSILEPSIDSLARVLGVHYIYVKPIGGQGHILTKYFGYYVVHENIDLFPSDMVATGADTLRKDIKYKVPLN